MARHVERILGAVDRIVAFVERATLAIGVLGMTTVSVANVIMRNVFERSLAFAGEVNMAFIIMVTFIGVGYAAREGRHIRMTALYDQFGQRTRKALMIVMTATTALLLFALAFYAGRYAYGTWQIGAVTPALRFPLAFIYAFAPLGLALGGIQYVLTLMRNLLEKDVYISFTQVDEYHASPVTEPEHI
ncbi:MAG: TRAP transporter small permease [Proteobacteria bacterium]|nr:TRAP transporter small permease [Pseudomonadota bacterium]